jgi:hypothetical protein
MAAASDNGPYPLSPYYISFRLCDRGRTFFVCTRRWPSGVNDVYGPDNDFERVQKIAQFLNANTGTYRPWRRPHVLRDFIQLSLDEETPFRKAVFGSVQAYRSEASKAT